MSWLSDIFGFLGGSKPSASTSPHATMSPEQQQALQALLQRLGGGGVNQYPGPTTTPGQDLSLGALEQQALHSVDPASQVAIAKTRATLSDLQSESFNDPSKYFDSAIRDPAIKDFQERIMPGIGRRFAGNSIFGSDARTAERQATEDLTRGLSGERSKLEFQAKESNASRALGASQASTNLEHTVGGIDSEKFAQLMKLFGAESIPFSQNYSEFTRQQGQNQTNIGDILAALGLKPFENITTTTPGTSGILGPLLSSFAGSQGGSSAITGWLSGLFGGGAGDAALGAAGTGVAGLAGDAAVTAGGGETLGALIPWIAALLSSKDFKIDKRPVNHEATLRALDELEVDRWKYRPRILDGEYRVEHIGPYAEDFHKLFGTPNRRVIPVVDAIGVTLSAVKGLSHKVRALEAAAAAARV